MPWLRRWGPRVFGAALLASAALVLWREVRGLDAEAVLADMAAWGAWRISAATALGAASFALVAVVEWMGLRWSGTPQSWRTTLLRSFMVNGLIHSLGANAVTAALTRAWVYRRSGVRLAASAATTAFAAVTQCAGVAVVAGAALLIADLAQLQAIRIDVGQARLAGSLLLGLVAAYLGACARWPEARLFAKVRLPRPAFAAAQPVIGAVDTLVSVTLLWLLVSGPAPPYAAFAVAYVLAYLGGLISTVPGGAGVFEAGLFLLLPDTPRAALAAAFLGFRLIFYLLPLLVALALALADALGARPKRRATTPAASASGWRGRARD